MTDTAVSPARVDLWFLKCADCLSVLAIETTRARPWSRDYPAPPVLPPAGLECGACAGKLATMGRVHRRGLGLVTHETQEVPEGCDDRCLFANGPKCECPCGAVHHGSGMLVTVQHVGSIPRATPIKAAEALARAEEFRAARAAALARIAPLGRAEYEDRAAGRYLYGEAWGRFLAYSNARDGLSRACRLKSHKGRMNAIHKIGVS